MKLFKLVLCGSLLLCPIGCGSQRESVMARPVVPVETSANGDATDAQITIAFDQRSHPICDKVRDSARTAGDIMGAAILLPVLGIAFTFGKWPPGGC